MRGDRLCGALLIAAVSSPLLAQIEGLAGGVVADSSIAAPVVSWYRISPNDDLLSFAVNGWQLSSAYERRLDPRRKLAASIAVTPINAHSSNRIYDHGERRGDLDFRDSSAEVTFGRIDTPVERWISDIRGVILYERVADVDAPVRDRWQKPYAGVRARQAWRRVRADDPFMMIFDGAEIGGTVEFFAGQRAWSRIEVDERVNARRGRWRAGQSVIGFSGHNLDVVNAFLVGGSWPVAGVHPLYGYRYGEFRLARGISGTMDLEYGMRPSTWIGVHGSALRAPQAHAVGVALSLTHDWNGVGLRGGVALPKQQQRQRNRVVFFASVLAGSFR
jgi:hypothetical protein